MVKTLKTLKTFKVTARLILITSIHIEAASYEDAVAEAKTLQETDFVRVKGELCDGSLAIASIASITEWDTEQP